MAEERLQFVEQLFCRRQPFMKAVEGFTGGKGCHGGIQTSQFLVGLPGARATQLFAQQADLLCILNTLAQPFEADRRPRTGIDDVGISGRPCAEPRIPQRIGRPRIVSPAQEAVVTVRCGMPCRNGRFSSSP